MGWPRKHPAESPSRSSKRVLDLLNDNPLTETSVTFDPLTGVQKLNRFGGQDTLFAFFINDDYKVTPRLLLSYGLRYDDFGNVSPFGFDTYTQTANIVLGPGNDYLTRITGAHAVVNSGGVYNGRRSNNWSPRGSFAYPRIRRLRFGGNRNCTWTRSVSNRSWTV